MLDRLAPRSLTNAYQGSWLAVWLLVPVLVMKTVIGFNFSGLNPFVDVAEVIKTVDGVPLDRFSQEAANAVLDSAAGWGMALFALCIFVWLILIRYRAGLPVAILVLLLEQVGRNGEGLVRVLVRLAAGAGPPSPGAWINLGMATLLLAAFLLSLTVRRVKA